ncbi:MAG TPA: HD-GYP domain-containing protein [Firmicutes bacterium]|uniref:HD-GYP domain-containing protein n=1 Tax=Capillibacterium thermochitinicola TaxID=2699427 RepID=A0A8J6HT52_9FIRM|nr:HD-GYP domain-containing protein [Capillibacterium thermochitinicola]MBA2133731.1 HD-GYP domain-containing protein [Capillibacterium thermochitinicola]HHW12871.1 HD-GYP domain-containing protein [Bacillota bacterium]
MRYLPLEEIEEGMILARSVFAEDGRTLLARGVKLTKNYLEELKALHFTHLFVGEGPEDFEVNGISEQTYSQALRSVREVFLNAAKKQNLDYKEVLDVVDFMVDEVLNEDVLFNIFEMRSHDNYTYLHSVKVGIIASIMGKNLGLARKQIKELAVGALLHDIGKMCIENSILEKSGHLTYQEYEKMRLHPKYGFEILRGAPGLSLLSAHVAYQHHEREDGSGYPRGLNSEQIHLYAKIVMTADSYDAMTSGRSYRRTLWSHEALAQLAAEAPEKYDPKMIKLLAQSVALYPVGSVVLLNNLEVGLVTDVTRESVKVEFLTGTDKGKKIALKANDLLKIERRLS